VVCKLQKGDCVFTRGKRGCRGDNSIDELQEGEEAEEVLVREVPFIGGAVGRISNGEQREESK
jgi:hypothetical protein